MNIVEVYLAGLREEFVPGHFNPQLSYIALVDSDWRAESRHEHGLERLFLNGNVVFHDLAIPLVYHNVFCCEVLKNDIKEVILQCSCLKI
jgi:hypothetical protein